MSIIQSTIDKLRSTFIPLSIQQQDISKLTMNQLNLRLRDIQSNIDWYIYWKERKKKKKLIL